MNTVLGHGAYSFPEAARLTRLRTSRVREWFLGRNGQRAAVFTADYQPVEGDCAISFLDLVDVFVAGQLRDHGLPLQTLRRAYRKMQEDLDTPHPFSRNELLTDGKAVFERGLDAEGRQAIRDIFTRQRVFPQILLPFLKKIDYGSVSRLAERWHISEGVVVDPALCLGQPVVANTGKPTGVLAAAYEANQRDADLVADWYNLHPDQVLAAVRFERGLAA